MENPENRMDKIAKSLTPRQRAIAWMEDAHQSKSLGEYAERTRHFDTLAKGAEIWARDRTKGEPAEKVQKTVRAAVRETAFLYFLHQHVNEHFTSQSRSIALLHLLLVERECVALEEATGTQLYADRFDPEHDDLRSYAIEVFTLKAAIQQIAKQYFDDHQVLLKYFAEQLEGFIRGIYVIKEGRENIYRAYEKGRKAKDPHSGDCRLKFDLETLKGSIDPGKTVKWLVDLAYFDTLEIMGDRQLALKAVASLYRQLPDNVRLDGD